MFDDKQFNLWVDEYDKMIEKSAKANKYPFVKYYDVLDSIYNEIKINPNSSVLDLGFGTSKLTSRLYELGCNIYGQDFSEKMIELSKNKMPNAKLYEGDFSKGLVESLNNLKYDFIISTYAFHHLNNEEKVLLIKDLLTKLKPNGKIIIGDIMFDNEEEMNSCKKNFKEDWDDEESYFVIDELKKNFLNLTFTKVSFCSGILVFKN